MPTFHQCQTDHGDDQPGDERRQRKADAANNQPQGGMKQPANQNAAKKCGQPINPFARHQWNHNGEKGKRRALHDRQLGPNRAKGHRLQEGGKTRKQHRHLDQIQQFGKIRAVRTKTKPGRACNNNGRCHIGHKHGQHVLDAKGNRLLERRHIVRVAQLRRCS